ncbi:HAMP domain-containing protein [Nitrosophilus labii]|uniref:HAMP domain-containing protein n=1 Tax=Nitrosophilus labii TaxID=2706014 RepID=UPI001656E9D0|nr:HAMP domain-containing protein [Nitrosophilus labii]
MSIKTKITALFLISLVLMLTLSFWIEKLNETKNQKLIISKYILAAKELIPIIANNDKKLLEKKLKELELYTVKNGFKTIIFQKPFTFGRVSISKKDGKYYLTIKYLDEKMSFYDKSQDIFLEEKLITNILLFFDILILFTIYFIILKIVSPIKELSVKMERFSKGDYDIRMDIKGDEEIKVAATSFNNMAKTLQKSIEDRENLLKYIGHELKTPLAKAKFAFEMKDYSLLEKNIKDIDMFVSEILNMHLLTTQNLKKSRFKAQTLITEALGKLYISEEENVQIELEDFLVEADIHYMSIALKNLIDNALKYTQKTPIKIVAKDNKIEVISYGERLKKDFSFYLEPFKKEASSGYGLGLSIVDIIVKKHGFSLFYRYLDGKNIFGINFNG